MTRGFVAGLVLFVCGLLCLNPPARAWWQSIQQVSVGAPAGYQGPIDVAGAAFGAWGLRCQSAAYCGGNLANVCTDIVGVDTCLDFSSNAATGNLVIVTIGGLSCAVVTCTIKTLYDQSGTADCSGACDVTEPTVANRPVLTPNCIGSLPCAVCTSAGSSNLTSIGTIGSHSQPFSASWVAKRTGAAQGFAVAPGSPGAGWPNTANTATAFSGSFITASATDGSPHAFAALFNTTSSVIAVDGSSTGTQDVGSANIATNPWRICNYFGGSFLDGFFLESDWWASDKSSLFSALSTNQRAYWGF